MTTEFTLHRNRHGHLTLTTADQQIHEKVAPVRAFPIQTPNASISIVSDDGKEIAWIDDLGDLSANNRQLVEEDLQSHEFMPEIRSINHVTSFAPPCTWQVDTDRGNTEFVLRGEEDIRRIGRDMLLIADTHGIHYLIRDMTNLNKISRRILDRFL